MFKTSLKQKIKQHSTLLIVLLLVLAGIIVAVLDALKPVELPTVTLQKGELKDTYTLTSVVAPADEISLTSEAGGDVLEVKVKPGEEVKKGAVIAVLSSADYDNEKLDSEAELAQIEADIADVKRQRSRALKDIDNSVAQFTENVAQIELQHKQDLLANVFVEKPMEQIHRMQADIEALQKIRYSCREAYEEYKSSYYSWLSLIWHKRNDDMSDSERAAAVASLNRPALDQMYQAYLEKDAEVNRQQKLFDQAVQNWFDLFNDGINIMDLDGEFKRFDRENYESLVRATQAQIDYLKSLKSTWNIDEDIAALEKRSESVSARIDRLAGKAAACTIKAPYDGIIRALPAEKTDRLAPGETAAVLFRTGKTQINCDVLTKRVYDIHVGDKVAVTVKKSSGNESFEGTVEKIHDYAEEGVSSLGLKEYRVRVVVVPPENTELLLGGDVETTFTTYTGDNCITVPISALYTEDGSRYVVYAVENGKLAEREVTVAYRTSLSAEISGGLSEGEAVAVNAGDAVEYVGRSIQQ